MDIKSKIESLIAPVIHSRELLLIDLIVRGDERKRIIEVYVDSANNISADLLAELSRQINNCLLTEEELIGNYRLDVSSPGVDRPLKFLAQYPKHVNRLFEVFFQTGNETKKIKAKLVSVNGDELLFNDGKNDIIVNYNQIIKAKVLISFS
jgi:ribosome maturation factor RimP